MTTTAHYTVSGPATPGAQPTEIARCLSLSAARRIAHERFGHRRDLRGQDVRIDRASDGHLVEYHGPYGR